MRLTKNQLKRIIREEKRRLLEGGEWETEPEFDRPQFRDESRYTNLSDQASSALDALEACVQDCLDNGCKDADILDTVEAMLDPEGWESHDVDVDAMRKY